MRPGNGVIPTPGFLQQRKAAITSIGMREFGLRDGWFALRVATLLTHRNMKEAHKMDIHRLSTEDFVKKINETQRKDHKNKEHQGYGHPEKRMPGK